MAWVVWVHKILAWTTWVVSVEISTRVAWVHKILAWVAWVKILAWVRKGAQMCCYLIILHRKSYVFYRTLNNYTNPIHQALQHAYFISYFLNPYETCVWCIFRFIFKFVLPSLLFKNCGYLFCLTIKKTMKEQEVKRQRKAKKIIFNSKKEFVMAHSFITPTKSPNFEPPHTFTLYA